jgi:5-methylcytosine-specific restriction enzyme subunit McrC
MILLNYRPDITGGSENVIAILFDMNKLWEEFIFRRLKKEVDKYSITVHPQQSCNFWQHELGSNKKIRPDIVVESGKQTIIIDTKWKNIGDHHPSDEDLKQMFVYNLFWECEKSFLLYPGVTKSSSGQYHSHETRQEMGSSCGVNHIQVLGKDGKLSKDIGTEIVKLIL